MGSFGRRNYNWRENFSCNRPKHVDSVIHNERLKWNNKSQSLCYIEHYMFQSWLTIIRCFFISMALPAHSGPWPLIQFRNHFSQSVGLLGRVISPSQGRYLNTGQHKHRINACTQQTSMAWVGFKPTIPAFERAKIVHALDRAATHHHMCTYIITDILQYIAGYVIKIDFFLVA
jgi:hypothetical protein